jgi:cobalt-zinc-cadmium resistance protein CzcA
MSRLGGEFIPSLPEGDFAVDTRVLPGSNLKTSTDAVEIIKNFNEKIPRN